ncbi:MAG TPA: hypothetical protein PKD20_00205 [Candidatus Saccharibacteria bacterium]|nr:hypothetical protein [Candidatus Saccharibacteria bacterium]HMT55278.1 hypothetical protein [Candidatus Saccharibacteria bacterium]
MKNVKQSRIINKSVALTLALIVFIFIGHYAPIRSAKLVNHCGQGAPEVYCESMLFQWKSIQEWEEEQSLLRGVQLYYAEPIDTPVTLRLFVL